MDGHATIGKGTSVPHRPEIPEGAVVITPNEMYQEMQSIGRKVDHLTSVLNPWQAEIRNEVTINRERIAEQGAALEARISSIREERIEETNKLDLRVKALENWRWFLAGIAVIGGPVGGYALLAVFGG